MCDSKRWNHEASVAEKWPKLKRDYAGRRVRALREIQTKGGAIFAPGETLEVTGWYRGLHLERIHRCEHCECRHVRTVTGVALRDVELLPEETE